MGAALFTLLVVVSPTAAADAGLFNQADIGPVSIGGRATYYDPKEGSGSWYGGGQVRFYPSRYFAFYGSADYRRNAFGYTRVPRYPGRMCALIYPFGTTRLG